MSDNFTLSRKVALDIAAVYDTVQTGNKNRYGPVYGIIHGAAASYLIEHGLLTVIEWLPDARVCRITEKGKTLADKAS